MVALAPTAETRRPTCRSEKATSPSYGAFEKLDDGVEALVHSYEMSWTNRIKHPSEVVTAQQKDHEKEQEKNKDKQQIRLAKKQVEETPW